MRLRPPSSAPFSRLFPTIRKPQKEQTPLRTPDALLAGVGDCLAQLAVQVVLRVEVQRNVLIPRRLRVFVYERGRRKTISMIKRRVSLS